MYPGSQIVSRKPEVIKAVEVVKVIEVGFSGVWTPAVPDTWTLRGTSITSITLIAVLPEQRRQCTLPRRTLRRSIGSSHRVQAPAIAAAARHVERHHD